MENYRKLPRRLKRFVEALAEGLTQKDAALRVKPDSRAPNKLGWKLAQIPMVQAALKELDSDAMQNAGISTTRTWLEVARIAYFDHRKLLDENGDPLPLHKLDDATVAGIAGIDVEELFAGRGDERVQIGALKKYRTWNKVDALKMILQAKKELIDRHELTGKDGGPIQYEDSRDRNLQTLDQISARLAGPTAGEAAASGTTSGDRGDGAGGVS